MPLCLIEVRGQRSEANAQEESVFYCVSPKGGMRLREPLPILLSLR